MSLLATTLLSLDLSEFIHRHHRLPKMGDTPAPWHYRGWHFYYVVELHWLIPVVADRWRYHLRTLEAGKLLDEPIPQIVFGPPNPHIAGLLHEWSRLIGYDHGGWSDFRTLVDWLCWSLCLPAEAPPLTEEQHEQLYRQVDLTPLLQSPGDYLGDQVATSKARGWNPTGFYPTPQDVVASNLSLCLSGQDIDPLAVSLCLINGALYAPWLSFPLPESIVPRHSVPPLQEKTA